jgi:hypothetical protein
MPPKRRIFLSAVSSEFGLTRDALAKYLVAQGYEAIWQDAFPDHQNAETLQRKLHDLIAGSDAVICLLGRRSGSYPPTDAAAPFADALPLPFTEASRTQWEFHFARRLKKPWRLFRAHADLAPEQATPTGEDHPDRQAAYLRWIAAQDFNREEFTSTDELKAKVALIDWRFGNRPPVDQPIVLPYQSLGSLFKGRDTFLTRLRQSLLSGGGGTAAIVSNAIHGAGGIGKTRASVEYAWAHRDDYTALLFVQADSPNTLNANLAALVGPLRLPEAAATDQTVQFHAVLAWLRNNPGWLLILDNVDTEPARDAALALLGQLHGGHVVLTSRLDGGGLGRRAAAGP